MCNTCVLFLRFYLLLLQTMALDCGFEVRLGSKGFYIGWCSLDFAVDLFVYMCFCYW